MLEYYFLLGANLGNKAQTIELAISKLVQHNLKLLQCSHIYETAAWGVTNQPDFYNVCVKMQSNLAPKEVLSLCKQVEIEIGRTQRERWKEREIDIDILLIDDKVIQEEHLCIPHKYLTKRMFALLPLEEVAAQKKHPILGISVQDLTKLCTDESSVKQLKRKCNQL